MDTWKQQYTDAANEILAEAEHARTKFAPFNSSHEGYAVIAEELDELWDDVKDNNVEAVHARLSAIAEGRKSAPVCRLCLRSSGQTVPTGDNT